MKKILKAALLIAAAAGVVAFILKYFIPIESEGN